MPIYQAEPVMSVRGEIAGYELLIRSQDHSDNTDEALFRWLGSNRLPWTVYVNMPSKLINSVSQEVVERMCKVNMVVIEWTEEQATEAAMQRAAKRLNEWSARGVRVMVDDVGRGQDGVGRLQMLDKARGVKIAREAILGAVNNPFGARLIGHIIETVRESGMDAVAEGMESRGLMETAKELGASHVQGHVFRALYRNINTDEVVDQTAVKKLLPASRVLNHLNRLPEAVR
jgi:EAL domain-containing protein (putative c-di-GMP-specific phosphodiesterase class I)